MNPTCILTPALRVMTVCMMLINPAVAHNALPSDPLPSWNEGPVKKSIIQFVHQVTDKTNTAYVVPEERIATIDNDGTLWVEQPLYTQIIFSLDRLKTLARQHPEWKTEKPFSLILKGDMLALKQLSLQDFAKILAVTSSGITVDTFYSLVKNWLNHAVNPHFNQPYTDLVYQPMLEVMHYLRANDFRIYIVTGGEQDFVRAYSEKSYGIAPDHVIGTILKTQYRYQSDNQPILIKQPVFLLIDDKTGKPEAINLFIACKPIIAFGNSDGDRQMLEWTQSNLKPHLMLLVHHDDAKREYAYGPESKVGTFSHSLMTEAKQQGWKIISMKKDWKVIFPFALSSHS